MARYIVLLRAVNVGGTGKLPMKDLRASLENAGYTNVHTLLASGNVVLDTAKKPCTKLETELEAHLARHHGLTSDVIVRTPDEWSAMIADNPMPDAAKASPSAFIAIVMKDKPDTAKAQTYLDAYSGSETISMAKRVVYIHFPDGMGRSRLNTAKFGTGTARNWNTVLKLAAQIQD